MRFVVHTPYVTARDAGFAVSLETSGALDIGDVDQRVHIIMDIKCPESDESARMQWNNIGRLGAKDQVKFVLADRTDYEYARGVIHEHGLADICPVLLSPASGCIDPRQLAEWMLADCLPARLQLQLHKLVWPADARGV